MLEGRCVHHIKAKIMLRLLTKYSLAYVFRQLSPEEYKNLRSDKTALELAQKRVSTRNLG